MALQIYCTQADCEARFTAERVAEIFSSQASDGTTGGTTDPTAFKAAATDASATCAAYLIGIHQGDMPLTTVPELITHFACSITMHFGARRRPEYAGRPEFAPYYAEWKDALVQLQKVREGTLRISKDLKPANTGGTFATGVAYNQRPGFFIADPNTGEGGFNSGDY